MNSIGATGSFVYPGGCGDVDYGQLDKTARQPSIPIRVPKGVGVITIQADDPLKTSYSVLYTEAKKRGIPITLIIPSMMSSLDVGGADPDLIRATDAQIAEMICKGGACPVFHSTSHDQWQADDLAWFKNEVLHNANYGDIKTTRTARADRWWDLDVADTPGDLIGAALQVTDFFETNGTGATHVDHEGFVPPGQWYDSGEAPDLLADSKYWDALREKWGRAFTLPGGGYIQSMPFDNHMDRIAPADAAGGYDTTKYQALIDAIIDGGQIAHIYWHEWLDNGETGATGEGSANAGKDPYTFFVLYDRLTGLLDAVQTAVKAGRLIVLGFGASAYIEEGEPVNLLPSLRAQGFQDNSLPGGWGAIFYSGSIGTYLSHKFDGKWAMDGPFLRVNRNGEAADRDIGWWHVGQSQGCQSYILSGYARVTSGAEKPKIIIYGALPEDHLTVDGTRMDRPTRITTGTETVGGLLTQPLYSYTMNGTDNVDISSSTLTYFQIPFTLPRPLTRYGILLTTSRADTPAASIVEYNQLRLMPNGV